MQSGLPPQSSRARASRLTAPSSQGDGPALATGQSSADRPDSGPESKRAASPTANFEQCGNARRIVLRGDWTVHTLSRASAVLAALQLGGASVKGGKGFSAPVSLAHNCEGIDLGGIGRMDTSGAMLLNQLNPAGPARLPFLNAAPGQRSLLDLSTPPEPQSRPKPPPFWVAFFHTVGHTLALAGRNALDTLEFAGKFLVALGRDLARPHQFRLISFVNQLQETGVGAIPIVALLSFLIGTVLAYMTAAQLATMGGQIYVVKLLEIAITREMGVLITAILVAGRSGSAFTAQIGAMVAGQEVSALQSMGVDPMRMLVTPRILALALALPMLVVVADIMGMLGGLLVMWLSMDIPPVLYMDTLAQTMHIGNFFVGLFKAPFFAVIVGCVGCRYGFLVGSGADSVGRMTTRSVVEGIFLVITLDAVFALVFTSLGI
ncbi:ABC transporter permease [Desulfovibrio sp. OttesenSCG-928-C14]|nr:ABC transporter permease [Desulfovibrio sp. OttesenSCG-928-C14]